MPAAKDITEQRFGSLVANHRAPGGIQSGGLPWFCTCDCGNTCVVAVGSLTSGNAEHCSKSCVLATKHGHASGGTQTPEYRAYNKARDRCVNSNNPRYADYGGRGIKFLFESFIHFLEHIGSRPGKDYSLDRYPNNDGNYEPGNVRWATRDEQQRNSRGNKLLSLDGEIRPLAEWAEIRGLDVSTVWHRIDSGRSIREALSPGRLPIGRPPNSSRMLG